MLDTEERPMNWEDFANKMFFIINNVGTSMIMKTSGLPPKLVEPFLNWNCFIVWS
jgi:hypothetical protein